MNTTDRTHTNFAPAYLGPAGTHSYQAACDWLKKIEQITGHAFPRDALQPFSPLSNVLEAVGTGHASFGVVPIENALEGSVVEMMEAIGLQKWPLEVLCEFLIPIQHALIQQKSAGPIETVMSHPQGLGQCRESLRKRFGASITLQATSSTAEAVRRVAEGGVLNAAALGTILAADLYDLDVVVEEMSDAPGNLTRFLVVGQPGQSGLFQEIQTAFCRQFPLKTSLCIGLHDRPGALADALMILKQEGLNLTRIESRPSKKQFGNYLFYLDIAGDLNLPQYANVVQALQQASFHFTQAGPYACLGTL